MDGDAGGPETVYYLLDTNVLLRFWENRGGPHLDALIEESAGREVRFVLYDRVRDQLANVVRKKDKGPAKDILRRTKALLKRAGKVDPQRNSPRERLEEEVDGYFFKIGKLEEFREKYYRRNSAGVPNPGRLEPVDLLLLAAYLGNPHLTLLTFDGKLNRVAREEGDRMGRKRMIRLFPRWYGAAGRKAGAARRQSGGGGRRGRR